MANSSPDPPRLLRVRSFSIENFRTFRERTVIELQDGVTVFHGASGAGKSTALAALDLYFLALRVMLQQAVGNPLRVASGPSFGSNGLTERDRPVPTRATVLSAALDPGGQLEIRLEPSGADFEITLATTMDGRARAAYLNQLFAFGTMRRPLAAIDARRRPRWAPANTGGSLLASTFASELYGLRTSKVAADRERWRAFAEVLTSFPTLQGATVSIERTSDIPELVIEYPGRVVLGMDELSSGEQELATLTAAVFLAKAPIIAIEEPEMGLDVATQERWRRFCEQQLAEGRVAQFIFESHSVTFDGARVVRFARDPGGFTTVESAEVSANSEAVAADARAAGATETFVSRDGYTRLPPPMQEELGTASGERLWFLRGQHTWEAWPETKLAEMLKEGEE